MSRARLGIDPKFTHEGMIDLGSQQMVQHVHGGSEEGPHIRLAGSPAENLGKVCFARPRISDQDNVGAVLQEVEIEQPEDAAFALHPRFVVLKVKGVDAGLGVEAREVEAPLNGAAVAGLQFEISQAFEGSSEAKVFRRRFLQRLFQLLAHRRQFQLFELLFQGSHVVPFAPRQ